MTSLLDQAHGTRIWLVDASIYVFRPWFSRKQVVFDTAGNPVHAVHGFLRFVQQLIISHEPQYIAFAFDTSLQTSIRKQIYPPYKANRATAPDELKYQFKCCRDFLDSMGLVQTASLAHEADDLIGAWAKQQRQADHQLMIISGDKDLAQLIQEHDLWWDFGQRAPLNAGGVKSSLGVWPEQIADQLALAGDKVDNIPGVPGIGMSIAAKLLKRFGTIDKLFEQLDQVGQMQIHGAKRVQKLLAEHQATVRLSRQLTGIECNIANIPNDLKRRPKDLAKLQALCELLGYSEEQYEYWAII